MSRRIRRWISARAHGCGLRRGRVHENPPRCLDALRRRGACARRRWRERAADLCRRGRGAAAGRALHLCDRHRGAGPRGRDDGSRPSGRDHAPTPRGGPWTCTATPLPRRGLAARHGPRDRPWSCSRAWISAMTQIIAFDPAAAAALAAAVPALGGPGLRGAFDRLSGCGPRCAALVRRPFRHPEGRPGTDLRLPAGGVGAGAAGATGWACRSGVEAALRGGDAAPTRSDWRAYVEAGPRGRPDDALRPVRPRPLLLAEARGAGRAVVRCSTALRAATPAPGLVAQVTGGHGRGRSIPPTLPETVIAGWSALSSPATALQQEPEMPPKEDRLLRVGVLGCGPIAQAAHFESCTKARNADALCDLRCGRRPARPDGRHPCARTAVRRLRRDAGRSRSRGGDHRHLGRLPRSRRAPRAGGGQACAVRKAAGDRASRRPRACAAVAAASGKVLQVGHMKRFDAGLQAAKALHRRTDGRRWSR